MSKRPFGTPELIHVCLNPLCQLSMVCHFDMWLTWRVLLPLLQMGSPVPILCLPLLLQLLPVSHLTFSILLSRALVSPHMEDKAVLLKAHRPSMAAAVNRSLKSNERSGREGQHEHSQYHPHRFITGNKQPDLVLQHSAVRPNQKEKLQQHSLAKT